MHLSQRLHIRVWSLLRGCLGPFWDRYSDPTPLLGRLKACSHCPDSGQDLRVFVIGGRVIALMLRYNANGSFKPSISRGGDGDAFNPNTAMD